MAKIKEKEDGKQDDKDRIYKKEQREEWMKMSYEDRMVEKARQGYVNSIREIKDVRFCWEETRVNASYKGALTRLIVDGAIRIEGQKISLDYDGSSVRVVRGDAKNYGGQLLGKLACEELSRVLCLEYEDLWVPERVYNEWMALWRFTIDNLSRQSMKISGLWFKIEDGKLEMTDQYEQYSEQEVIEEESLMMLLTIMDCPLDVSFAVEQTKRYHTSPITEAKSMVMRGTYATQSVWGSFYCAGNDVKADPVIGGTMFYHIKAERDTVVDVIVRRNRKDIVRHPYPVKKGNNGNIRMEIVPLSDQMINFDVRKNYKDSMNANFIWKARSPIVVSTTLWVTYSKAYATMFLTYADYEDISSMAYKEVVKLGQNIRIREIRKKHDARALYKEMKKGRQKKRKEMDLNVQFKARDDENGEIEDELLMEDYRDLIKDRDD